LNICIMQRLVSFRQGDRSEYLAQYILSSIAISVPVPRQEDVGSDFHCTLLRREGNNLRPYLPFNIQIKSFGEEVVRFGGVTDAGNWRKHEIEQLCQTDTPFFIGIVNRDEQWMDVFCTINRYFVFYNWHQQGPPRTVELIPYSPDGEGHLGAGELEALEPMANTPNWLWKLPIGQPMVRISIGDAESPERCEEIKSLLGHYLRMDQENAVFARIGVGYFSWPVIIRTGINFDGAVGLSSAPFGSPMTTNQLRVLARSVSSLLVSLRGAELKEQIIQWEGIINQLPIGEEPPVIQQAVEGSIAFAHS
jgi:hypothetical protein